MLISCRTRHNIQRCGCDVLIEKNVTRSANRHLGVYKQRSANISLCNFFIFTSFTYKLVNVFITFLSTVFIFFNFRFTNYLLYYALYSGNN